MNALLGKLALLLDGVWDALTYSVQDVQWLFASHGRVLLLVGGALALVVAVISYIKTTEGLTTRMRILLAAIRFAAVTAVIVIASGAVCQIQLRREEPPELLVLVDDSPSMQEADTGGTSRLDSARDALKNRLPVLDSYSVRTLTTSEVLNSPAEDLPQSLADAIIRAASQQSKKAPLAQVLAITDGSQIERIDLAAAARNVGTPVSVLGYEDEVKDVVVQNVIVPPFVYNKDRTLVTAEINSHGLEGEANVKLFAVKGTTETEVTSKKIKLGTDGQAVPARLEFAADGVGLQHYVVRVDALQGEATDKNNLAHFHLDIRGDKIRVLVIEGSLNSYEYDWLRKAFASDPAIEFYGLACIPPDEWFFQGPKLQPDKKPVLSRPQEGFPASVEELSYFDVLVLGDVDRKMLEKDNRFELIRDYILQRGGGLATYGGMNVYGAGSYEDTVLAELLPVRVEREKKKHLINRFNVELTSRGLMHPVMQLEYDPVANAQAWKQLPWVEGGNAWQRVKPGATTLLVHPELKTAYGPRPVAAVWQCGRGRVFSTALDGTWHWGFARKDGTPDYHKRFWGLVARWLAGDPRMTRGNELVLETPVCEVGKDVVAGMMLRSPNGLPITDADVVYDVEYPTGQTLKIRASVDPGNPGWYGIRLQPQYRGDYAVRSTCTFDDGTEQKSELKFYVAASKEELMNLQADAASARKLTKATGGTFGLVATSEAFKLPESEPQAVSVLKVVNLWHAPGLVLLAVLCLSIEWFLRKRRGLS